MNDYDEYDMDSMLNTSTAKSFLNNGIIDERLNKLFTGERSNIKHKSFKKELAIRLRQAKMIDNKIKKI